MVSAGPTSLKSRGKSSRLLPPSAGSWHSLVFQDLQLYHSSLCLCLHVAFFTLCLHEANFYMSTWVAPSAQVKHHLWVCLWGCFQMRKHSELADLVNVGCPSQCGREFPPVCWEPEWNRRQRKEELVLFSLPHWFIWEISFHPLALGLGFTSLSPLVLRLDLDLNCVISFPGSSVCKCRYRTSAPP